ncbi:MAG: SDR family oxidoreductase [Granulosicoccus sp.]
MQCKLVLITGGQRGIGLGIARAFTNAGCDVLIADIAESEPDTAIATDGQGKQKVVCYRTDVSDETDVALLFEQISKDFGRMPDVLINNAAVQIWAPLLELSLKDWQRTIEVNLTGSFLMTQHFARQRVAAGGGGVIINLGSGCNRLAFPNLVSYAASKGGIEMLTRGSALELGKHGIRVNCVAPGAIITERTAAETDEYADSWSSLTPLGRVGQVEDVADVVVSLCEQSNRFVSGQTLYVDGGLFSAAAWPAQY